MYSFLAGLPQTQIKRPRAAQNVAARTVTICKKTDHITPILRQLHWLPIRVRIHREVFFSATNLSVHGDTPLYLSELFHSIPPVALSDQLQDLSQQRRQQLSTLQRATQDPRAQSLVQN